MLQLLKIAGEVADPTTQPHRKAFLGAVAIRRDGTLVYSRNGITIRPDQRQPSAHAEARVLRKAGYGSVVYVCRVNRKGEYLLAKPCVSCMNALRSRGVEMVYWSISNNEWEARKP